MRPNDDNERGQNGQRGLTMLFADDEASLRELMQLELPRMGHRVAVCPDGATAAEAVRETTFDCILVDLDMPGLGGIELIALTKEVSPETDAIVLTGKGTMETAIQALRHGAFDYLTKPCRLLEVRAVLDRVAKKRELENKYRAAKRQLQRIEGTSELIGDSEPMGAVRRRIAKIAPTNSTVLILGETGTGKELVARSLHDQSLRAEKPFVAINCGALPENLIESELFGHRKGAFTGADEHRTGLFEVADGGTLFLDEIGEMPLAVQAKLLRFLESGELRRLGENTSFTSDVRVLCATHRSLEEMIEEERFRQDLWFRINTLEVALPSLRERCDDIPALTRRLVARFEGHGTGQRELFTEEAFNELKAYSWPGNVRELANVVEHALILGDTPPLGPESLPSRIRSTPIRLATPDESRAVSSERKTLRQIELDAIHDALAYHNGNKPKAAEELGVSLKTLYNKLNQENAARRAA